MHIIDSLSLAYISEKSSKISVEKFEINNIENMENVNEVRCGLCGEDCDPNSANRHSCLSNGGYKMFWTNPKTSCFYPLLDDKVNIVVKINDNGVEKLGSMTREELQEYESSHQTPESPEKTTEARGFQNSKRKLPKLSYDLEEALILKVQEREPLWNHKMPLIQRTGMIKARLWNDVSQAIGGKLSADAAKKKFKNLYDTYRHIIQTEATKARKHTNKWHHYDSMEFLRDLCLSKETASNMQTSDADVSYDVNNSINLDDNVSDVENSLISIRVPSKKRRCSEDVVEASNGLDLFENKSGPLERIANAICSVQGTDEAPRRDEIDSIIHVIECRVRKLPYNVAMEFLNKCMMDSYALRFKTNS